jgi:CheY-like chemotaxis protein
MLWPLGEGQAVWLDEFLFEMGLGLAIVKSLVAMHGGSITVESAGLGQGSEFTIRLPAHDGPVRELYDRPARAIVEPSGLTTPTRDARRIMIVDDNEDAAQVLAEALKSIGHCTQIAYDAPSALQSVSAFAPDVMLLDIGLPVMDGYELARAIRTIADLNLPRLIALTGYGQEADRRRALEAGFNEHLVKPIDLNRLLSVLDAKGN